MSTLNALAEFYEERDSKEKHFERLQAQAEDEYATQKWSMEVFAEDWNASQFWVWLACTSEERAHSDCGSIRMIHRRNWQTL